MRPTLVSMEFSLGPNLCSVYVGFIHRMKLFLIPMVKHITENVVYSVNDNKNKGKKILK